MKKVIAKNRAHLTRLIDEAIEKYGPNCDLNFIDVSRVKNMERLFKDSDFNGDISDWDVSNVTKMGCMFENSAFNGDISDWDVSNVNSMYAMFYSSAFNSDISQWDVRNVTNMYCMFTGSYFNGDISQWSVFNVQNMKFMFTDTDFKGDISSWLPALKKNRIDIKELGLPETNKTLKLLRKRELMDQIRNENFSPRRSRFNLSESYLRSVKKYLNENGYSVKRRH